MTSLAVVQSFLAHLRPDFQACYYSLVLKVSQFKKDPGNSSFTNKPNVLKCQQKALPCPDLHDQYIV